MIWIALAAARPVDPASPQAKLTHALAELAARPEMLMSRPAFDGESTVRVVVECDGDCTIPGEELRWEGRVQARLAPAELLAVAALPGVRHLREPWIARPKVESEGLAEVMDLDWSAEGVDGQGVKVGIIDVGFAGCEDLSGSEVPSDYEEAFSLGAPESSAHGCAVAEVIHDFAPGAELRLASFGTDVELGVALQGMLDAGVDVVNASIGFDNVWHADGTSPVTVYADTVVEAGVIYVAAAGNENDNYRVGALSPVDDGPYVGIDGRYAILARAPGGTARVSFRWSEPFGEAATDLDLVLFNADDGRECGRSESPQDGDDNPYEEVYVEGCEEWVYASIYADVGTDVDGLTGYLYGYADLDEADLTGLQSLTLPGDCFDCVAVGAIVDDVATDYSSRGPSDDGRTKPEVVAPSNVSTASFGEGAFKGSSAAAPHAAGLLALWVDATKRHGEPLAAREWLLDGARDLGPAGDDDTYGAGAVAAGELPPEQCGCAVGTPGPLATLLVLLGLGRWRS
ncbi:MAG: S8 family serine peptidase [Deltaproteobacteria bacterium]|nr:S8 family serine peptidase [Deltaproteobacteria bacterium]